eukprot:COSAG02_NODE_1797_length_10902_cov_25.030177_8_plen_678_part_00
MVFSSELSPTTSKQAVSSIDALNLDRLVRRLVSEDGLGDEVRARAAIAAYKQLLRLAASHRDVLLQPAAAVDAVWQRHLLDTKAYHDDCASIFGGYAHRRYPQGTNDDKYKAVAHTVALLETEIGTVDKDIWGTTPLHNVYIDLAPRRPPSESSVFSKRCQIEDVDLDWLGTVVAVELPLKQSQCRNKEPLALIVMEDTAAAVVEYKKFLRLMIDQNNEWFTPSKLVDELWHRHILDSERYMEFCQQVAGEYLHHVPHYGKPHAYHNPGYATTLKAYETKFGEAPAENIWGIMGESGGGGCGGGCGGGSGGGGGGGGGGGTECSEGEKQCWLTLLAALSGVGAMFGVWWLMKLWIGQGICRILLGSATGLLCDQLQGTAASSDREASVPAVADLLSSCVDINIDDNSGGVMPWESINIRTGRGKSCAMYEEQGLCNLCSAIIPNNPTFTDVDVGGPGWSAAWGTPADGQYANQGHTSTTACCICGGGHYPGTSEPAATVDRCTTMAKACSEMDSCSSKSAWITLFGVIPGAILLCFCCAQLYKCNIQRLDKRRGLQKNAMLKAEERNAEVVWEFDDQPYGYRPLDSASQSLVESAYIGQQAGATFTVKEFTYSVNFHVSTDQNSTASRPKKAIDVAISYWRLTAQHLCVCVCVCVCVRACVCVCVRVCVSWCHCVSK